MHPVSVPSPAGWYQDPWRLAQWRWWDGTAWTGYTDAYYAPASHPAPYPWVSPPRHPVVEIDDRSVAVRAGWTALLGAVVGVALSFVFYLALRGSGVARSSPLLILGAQLGLWTGLLGACILAVRRHGTGSLRDLGFRFRAVDLALGPAFGIAGLMMVGSIALVLKALGIEPERESFLDPMARGWLTTVVVVFTVVIGAPLVEELYFRGLIMSGLVTRFGVAIGVIAQAVLFGLVHLGPADAQGNLGVFLLIAPLGAGLGVLRHGFKRLGPGILAHGAYNGVIVVVALSQSGSF